MSAFQNPQSVFRRMGHTQCSLTAHKYKAAGTNKLLFDFTTASHKTFLENPTTYKLKSDSHFPTWVLTLTFQHEFWLLPSNMNSDSHLPTSTWVGNPKGFIYYNHRISIHNLALVQHKNFRAREKHKICCDNL